MKNKFVNILVKILIVIIITGIGIFAFFIYSNAKEEVGQNDKIESEIDYMDTKITNLINQLNRYSP